jgi:hypothetical protein
VCAARRWVRFGGCGLWISWEGAGAFGSNLEAVLAAICMIAGEVFPCMMYCRS